MNPAARDPARTLDDLLRRADDGAPGAIAESVLRSLEPLGAESVEIFLADYGMTVLRGTSDPADGDIRTHPVDGPGAGRCYLSAQEVHDDRNGIFWAPITERGDVMGVLEVGASTVSDDLRAHARRAGRLAAHLIASADHFTDLYRRVREREELSVAAELQWSNLPPESFASDAVAIASTVEPAYDIGGDGYDYNVGSDAVDFALLDAMGRGLPACLSNLVAMAAMRSSRRAGASLPATVQSISDAMRDRDATTNFVTCVVGRLDLPTGRVRWVNAGHPSPWIVDARGTIRQCDGERRPPAGVPTGGGPGDYPVREELLEPGEVFVLMSDGAMDHRDPETSARAVAGRVSEIYSAAPRGARTAVRTVAREVLDREKGRLSDDATILMLARPRARRSPAPQ